MSLGLRPRCPSHRGRKCPSLECCERSLHREALRVLDGRSLWKSGTRLAVPLRSEVDLQAGTRPARSARGADLRPACRGASVHIDQAYKWASWSPCPPFRIYLDNLALVQRDLFAPYTYERRYLH